MIDWKVYGFEKNPVEVIKTTKDRWIKAKQDLEDAKYIENLIHADFIHSIKAYTTDWDYRLSLIDDAAGELNITDGRKKKPALNCLNHWIKVDFFAEVDADIKVNSITYGGLECYYSQMDFEINGETYSISIPNKEVINMDNASYAYEGKYAFAHKTSECSITVEYTDYTKEGMAKFIKEYFGGNKGDKTNG